mmetsp:Transcript_42286/g.128290  ORF Transcript_42286/g.128290 Transcript_42286/m.128290 type:complete len:295 (+) Transcript_42286:851-1735(+)
MTDAHEDSEPDPAFPEEDAVPFVAQGELEEELLHESGDGIDDGVPGAAAPFAPGAVARRLGAQHLGQRKDVQQPQRNPRHGKDDGDGTERGRTAPPAEPADPHSDFPRTDHGDPLLRIPHPPQRVPRSGEHSAHVSSLMPSLVGSRGRPVPFGIPLYPQRPPPHRHGRGARVPDSHARPQPQHTAERRQTSPVGPTRGMSRPDQISHDAARQGQYRPLGRRPAQRPEQRGEFVVPQIGPLQPGVLLPKVPASQVIPQHGAQEEDGAAGEDERTEEAEGAGEGGGEVGREGEEGG